jgi:hypothetical protein
LQDLQDLGLLQYQMRAEPKPWWIIKAKIIGRFGSITAAAQRLNCSSEGIRSAAQGKCPGIMKRLEKELANS